MANSNKIWGPTTEVKPGDRSPTYGWTTPEQVIKDFNLQISPEMYRNLYNSGVDPYRTFEQGIPTFQESIPQSMADPTGLGATLAMGEPMPDSSWANPTPAPDAGLAPAGPRRLSPPPNLDDLGVQPDPGMLQSAPPPPNQRDTSMPSGTEVSALTGPAAAKDLAAIIGPDPSWGAAENALARANLATGTTPEAGTAVAPGPGGPTIGPGFKNAPSAVRQWQQFLTDQGLYKGPVDGKFGHDTTLSTKLFQTLMGVNADGVVGRQTLHAQHLYQAIPGQEVGPDGTTVSVPGTPYPRPRPGDENLPNVVKTTDVGPSDIPQDEFNRQLGVMNRIQPTVGVSPRSPWDRSILTDPQLASIAAGGNPDIFPSVDPSRAITFGTDVNPQGGTPETQLGRHIAGIPGDLNAPGLAAPRAPPGLDTTQPGYTGSYYNARPGPPGPGYVPGGEAAAASSIAPKTAAETLSAAKIIESLVANGAPAAPPASSDAGAGAPSGFSAPGTLAQRAGADGFTKQPAVPETSAPTQMPGVTLHSSATASGGSTPTGSTSAFNASGMKTPSSFDASTFRQAPAGSGDGGLGAILASTRGADTGISGSIDPGLAGGAATPTQISSGVDPALAGGFYSPSIGSLLSNTQADWSSQDQTMNDENSSS